jgi:competence protein ComEC
LKNTKLVSLLIAILLIFSSIAFSPMPLSVQPIAADSGTYTVHFVDVGQGDSELIITPHKNVVLIDGGEQGSGIIPYLKAQGISTIDVIVATHPHADHIGGLVDVMNGSFTVKKVITNGRAANTGLFNKFLDGIFTVHAEYVEAKRGDSFAVDGMKFSVVSPTASFAPADINNTSLVIWMKYGGASFLFTGDEGFDGETNLLATKQVIRADILKVGHHGSSTSTSAAFLKAVAPKVAVYSAGVNNSYHHPAASTITRIKSVVPKIYGTDVNGNIVVTVTQTGYQIKTSKQSGTSSPTSASIQPTKSTTAANPLVNVVSLTSPASKGSTATLTINTLPGAICTITVYYKSGPSTAAGLGQKTADASGNVSWSWKVGTKTTAGVWRIVVTARSGSKTVTQEIPFKVR